VAKKTFALTIANGPEDRSTCTARSPVIQYHGVPPRARPADLRPAFSPRSWSQEMNYPPQRRTELRIAASVAAMMGILFAWLAVAKNVPTLWWLAGIFFLPVPLLSWRATRSDAVFQREQARFVAFTRRHPILWPMLVVCSTAIVLWGAVSAILRFFGS